MLFYCPEKDTIRQGLERFMVHGYTAVPVLNDQEQYIGSVTEGDFLRHLLVCQTTDLKVQEGYRLGSIVRRDFCPALQIDADSEQVVTSMLNQNFVPIVDGRNALCGILTRKRDRKSTRLNSSHLEQYRMPSSA